MLIHWGVEKEERKEILQEAYDIQYPILKRSKTIKRLQKIADKQSNEWKIENGELRAKHPRILHYLMLQI